MDLYDLGFLFLPSTFFILFWMTDASSVLWLGTNCMKKVPALRMREGWGQELWYSLSVAEHPPLLKANYKYIHGGLSSWTWNIACNLKVNILSQQLVCYFGAWQLKVVRERSDVPVTPAICFITMFSKVFAHFSAPKAAHGDEAVTTPSCQQKRASFLSMHLPLPSPQLSILSSALSVTCQGAGAALMAMQGQKRKKQEKAEARKKIPSPFDGSKISLCHSYEACSFSQSFTFPLPGWLVHESFTLPQNMEKHFLKTWEMRLDDHEIWKHVFGSSSGKKSQFFSQNSLPKYTLKQDRMLLHEVGPQDKVHESSSYSFPWTCQGVFFKACTF